MTMTTVAPVDLGNYFLSWVDVTTLTNSSESTIRRAIRKKKFPSQVSLFGNKGKVGFRKADIYLWCEGRRNIEGGV